VAAVPDRWARRGSSHSKEWLLFNEELLLLGISTTFVYAVYIAFGETVRALMQSEVNTIRERHLDKRDLNIDHVNRFITLERRNMSYPEDLKALREAEVTLANISIAYQNAKYQADVHTATLAKLKMIASIEDSDRKSYKDALARAAADHVRMQFANADAETKLRAVDLSIDAIPADLNAKSRVDPQADPVAQMFADFLQKRYTPEQLGIISRVPAIVAKDLQSKSH